MQIPESPNENVQFLCDFVCKTHFLVLKNDFPHAEVEHGADVDDEEQGADYGECEDRCSGWTSILLSHRAEHFLTCARPVHGVHFEISH